jgi:hypothetical protein
MVPTQGQWIMRIMHFEAMHYEQFNCNHKEASKVKSDDAEGEKVMLNGLQKG